MYLKEVTASLSEYASRSNAEAFDVLRRFLFERSKVMNLTAISEPEAVLKLHVIDSLYAARALDGVLEGLPSRRIADVGSGAGFPALPIATVRREVNVTAIDSTEKKCRYIGDCAEAMGLSNVTPLSGRAEELARGELRDSFGAVVSRAVARLPVLLELCLPLCAVGGVMLAMKGAAADEEEKEAADAAKLLGAVLEARVNYTIAGYADGRTILVFRKLSPTPDKYPRHFSKISKAPL